MYYVLNKKYVLIVVFKNLVTAINVLIFSEDIKNSTKTVSYTHLDVYKRQQFGPTVL